MSTNVSDLWCNDESHTLVSILKCYPEICHSAVHNLVPILANKKIFGRLLKKWSIGPFAPARRFRMYIQIVFRTFSPLFIQMIHNENLQKRLNEALTLKVHYPNDSSYYHPTPRILLYLRHVSSMQNPRSNHKTDNLSQLAKTSPDQSGTFGNSFATDTSSISGNSFTTHKSWQARIGLKTTSACRFKCFH